MERQSPKLSPADALIAEVSGRRSTPLPEGDWKTALERLCAHNDAQTSARARVSSQKAVAMLREHFGWTGGHKSTLDKLCIEHLGRSSYGTR